MPDFQPVSRSISFAQTDSPSTSVPLRAGSLGHHTTYHLPPTHPSVPVSAAPRWCNLETVTLASLRKRKPERLTMQAFGIR
jgi:hypothetical protein